MSNWQSGRPEDLLVDSEHDKLDPDAVRTFTVPYSFGAIYKHRAHDIPLWIVMGGGSRWQWWRWRWKRRWIRLRAACARRWTALRA